MAVPCFQNENKFSKKLVLQISKAFYKRKESCPSPLLQKALKRAPSPLAISHETRSPLFSLSCLLPKKETRKIEKEKKPRASRRYSEFSLKSQPFYRRYKPILPTSLNYIVLNRPEAIHLGDLMRFLVRIDPNRSTTKRREKIAFPSPFER